MQNANNVEVLSPLDDRVLQGVNPSQAYGIHHENALSGSTGLDDGPQG